jgi:hypothetical protein
MPHKQNTKLPYEFLYPLIDHVSRKSLRERKATIDLSARAHYNTQIKYVYPYATQPDALLASSDSLLVVRVHPRPCGSRL